MRQDKKLMLGMAILFFITFVSLGTLVVTEKLAPFYTDKIKERMTDYINEKYPTEKDNLKIGKITYQAQVYKAKVTNKKNDNLYFTITYQNKDIKDTYQKDYSKGKTLITTIEKNLEKKIKDNLNIETTISFPLTLNKYTNQIKENMINNNLDNINVYDIELSIPAKLKATNIETIVNDINTTVTNLHSININPNHYTINIKSDEERRMLTIYDLTDATLQKDSLTHVLNYIMIDNEKEEITEGEKIVNQYSLSYEYIRYGDEEDE